MTKQELINTYDSMSMPEEHVEAIEARLKKLYDNPSPSSAPEVPEESTREYKFDRKKPSAVTAAVISMDFRYPLILRLTPKLKKPRNRPMTRRRYALKARTTFPGTSALDVTTNTSIP